MRTVVVQSFDNVKEVIEIKKMIKDTDHMIVVEHGDSKHSVPTLYRPNTGRDYGAYLWFIVTITTL